jgi:hypothetical protein
MSNLVSQLGRLDKPHETPSRRMAGPAFDTTIGIAFVEPEAAAEGTT